MLRQLTDAEVEYYHQHIPRIEARRHYSTAQLNADFREMFFPRFLDPDPKGEPQEPPRRRQPWTPDEMLPHFAYFERLEPMPREVAAALVGHFDALPEWARKLAPIGEARALLD